MDSRLSYAVVSNVGGRSVNEDSVAVCANDTHVLLLLCDGLGGHGMGDVASGLVKDVFGAQFKQNFAAENFLDEAFSASEDILMAKQKELRKSLAMKTTAVALLTDGNEVRVGHVGDSRLYIFQGNRILRRTLDHSVPQMLVAAHEIKEKEIRNHPDRSYLLKVLGIPWEEPMYELMKPFKLKENMSFLLCSDGFWELIDEKEMCALLRKSKTVNEWLEKMNALVQEHGVGVNMDNNSAIAAWYR